MGNPPQTMHHSEHWLNDVTSLSDTSEHSSAQLLTNCSVHYNSEKGRGTTWCTTNTKIAL